MSGVLTACVFFPLQVGFYPTQITMVSVLLNNGTGFFAPPVNYTVGPYSWYLA
jgi:hypothetical protein